MEVPEYKTNILFPEEKKKTEEAAAAGYHNDAQAFFDNPNKDYKPPAKTNKTKTNYPVYRLSNLDAKALLEKTYGIPDGRRVDPPGYYENADIPHRSEYDKYHVRIGDCTFKVPPEFIGVGVTSSTDSKVAPRQINSVKTKAGYSKRTITIRLMFNGAEQINGYDVKQGYNYWMDGLRSLLAQFKRCPFVPVESELLNNVHEIYNVILTNITVNTVPGFPQSLQAQITLREFNATPYIEMPNYVFDSMINWDLFRWHYQRAMWETDAPDFLRPIHSTSGLLGRWSLNVLDQDVLTGDKSTNNELGNTSNYNTVMDQNSGLVLTDIYAGFQNIVSELQLSAHGMPTFQYLGGMDTYFTMMFETMNRDAIKDLYSVYEQSQSLARDFKSFSRLGFIHVNNELINMFGVKFAMINSINIETVDGFPDLFRVVVELVSYDITQHDREAVGGMKPMMGDGRISDAIEMNVNGLRNKIKQDKYITEELAKKINLYPDLSIPTVEEVNAAILKINTFRASKGLSGMGFNQYPLEESVLSMRYPQTFVDPDFYVFYPTSYMHTSDDVMDMIRSANKQTPRNTGSVSDFSSASSGTSSMTNWAHIGDLAAKYESGGKGAGSISSGNGDSGGKSYGTHQFSSTKGSLQSFVNSLKSSNPDWYNRLASQTLASTGFDNVWRAIYNEEPEKFAAVQAQYIAGSFYIPTVKKLRDQFGIDADTRSFALQSVIWSTAVQHGTGGVITVFRNAAGSRGSSMSDRDLINAVYDERSADKGYKYFSRNSAAVIASVYRRLNVNERADAMALLGNSNMTTGGLQGPTPSGATLDTTLMSSYSSSNISINDIGKPIKAISPVETQDYGDAVFHDNSKMLERMLVDTCEYNRRGRLARAFPTYLFMFLDESGDWLDAKRLWTNYYPYKSLVNVVIHQERVQPVHTATIQLTNVYENLSTAPKQKDWEAEQMKKDWLYKTFGIKIGTPKLTQEMVDDKNKTASSIQSAKILPGARIHIRLGYGNNPSTLPVTFNGLVTEVDAQDIVTMTAQGDGAELINNVISTKPGDTNGLWNLGSEPATIIKNILQNRESWINAVVKDWKERNAYGIEHFGIYLTDLADKSYMEKKEAEQRAKSGSSLGDFAKAGQELYSSSFTSWLWSLFNNYGVEAAWNTYGVVSGEVSRYNRKNKDVYDLCKNVYLSTYESRPYLRYEETKGGKDEQNINSYVYNKTPWDVFQTVAQASPEYVCQPMYHGFESRVFFGHPVWNAKYLYDTDGGKVYEYSKPFAQIHIIDSLSDIIDNQIKIDRTNIFTNCVATYTVDKDTKTTPTLYADKDIWWSQQKTKIIDTSAWQNFPLLDNALKWFAGYEPAENTAIQIAVSNIIDSFQKSYDNPIIVIGDPSIKPCDFVFLNDEFTEMNGTVTAREVIHEFGIDTGFITSIIPDMVVGATSIESPIANVVGTIGPALVSTVAFKVVRWAGIKALARVGTIYTDGASVKSIALGAKKLGSFFGKMIVKGDAIKDFKKAVDSSKAAINSAKELKTVKHALDAGKSLKAGATGIGTAVAPGLGTIVAFVASTILIDTIFDSVIDFISYNNMIRCYPLVYQGRPMMPVRGYSNRLVAGANDQ